MGKNGRTNPSPLVFPLLLAVFLELTISYATGLLVFDSADKCKEAGGRWQGSWRGSASCVMPQGGMQT